MIMIRSVKEYLVYLFMGSKWGLSEIQMGYLHAQDLDGWMLAKFFFSTLSQSINMLKKNSANIQPS